MKGGTKGAQLLSHSLAPRFLLFYLGLTWRPQSNPPYPMGVGSQQLNTTPGPAPTTGLDTLPALVNTHKLTFHTGGIKQILTLPKKVQI